MRTGGNRSPRGCRTDAQGAEGIRERENAGVGPTAGTTEAAGHSLPQAGGAGQVP